MGITDSISMGKMQMNGIKIQMEIEQRKLADTVCAELNEDGFACKVITNGMQTMRAGIVPIRIERLKIVPVKQFNVEKMEQFEKEKERITKYWAEARQAEYKQEMRELKKKKKEKND
jgi:hypothetical protein